MTESGKEDSVMRETDAILEAIRRVDGRMGGLENRIDGVHTSTGQLKVDVGVLRERIDNAITQVDKLNGRVESAITTASEAETIAKSYGGASGRKWGLIISATITGIAGIIVALIHWQGA